MNTARAHGFESRLVERARARANGVRPRIPETVTTDDVLYRVLLEELHPAMVAHYLVRTGWGFREWDSPDGAGGDVDLAVTSPTGEPVDIQIKVPGTESALAALEKAARQLRASPHRTAIVVCSRRSRFVSCEPGELLGLIGSTVSEYGAVRLAERGRFASADWAHVGGVALLDYIPGEVQQKYTCTVLLNPWCNADVAIERDGFPVPAYCASKRTAFAGAPVHLTAPLRSPIERSCPRHSRKLLHAAAAANAGGCGTVLDESDVRKEARVRRHDLHLEVLAGGACSHRQARRRSGEGPARSHGSGAVRQHRVVHALADRQGRKGPRSRQGKWRPKSKKIVLRPVQL